MIVESIQVGLPRALGDPTSSDPFDKPWTSGFHKSEVKGDVFVGLLNIEGDGQADLKHHGGPDKAINAYPREHQQYWESELGIELPHGSFGENLTVSGACEEDVCIGDIFQLGDVVVQVTQPRQPCWKLARRWRIKDLAVRVEQTGLTGWYFRVLKEGTISAPGEMTLIERPHPEWTVKLANEIMHHRKADHEIAKELSSCPALSQSWKASLSRRSQRIIDDDSPRLEGSN